MCLFTCWDVRQQGPKAFSPLEMTSFVAKIFHCFQLLVFVFSSLNRCHLCGKVFLIGFCLRVEPEVTLASYLIETLLNINQFLQSLLLHSQVCGISTFHLFLLVATAVSDCFSASKMSPAWAYL